MSATYVVLKNLPMPARGAAAKPSKYPLEQLEVGGDAIFIPEASKSVPVTLGKIAKRLGIKVSTRKINSHTEFDADGNGVGDQKAGIAVWRTA